MLTRALLAASAALPGLFPPVTLKGTEGPTTHVDAGIIFSPGGDYILVEVSLVEYNLGGTKAEAQQQLTASTPGMIASPTWLAAVDGNPELATEPLLAGPECTLPRSRPPPAGIVSGSWLLGFVVQLRRVGA